MKKELTTLIVIETCIAIAGAMVIGYEIGKNHADNNKAIKDAVAEFLNKDRK